MNANAPNLSGRWNYPTSIRFGAGRIRELPSACRELGMSKPLLVTDAGLAKLSALTKLTSLQLDTVDLADGGVAHVAAFKGLQQLDLYHTLVTDKGYLQLKQALPGCVIHYSRDSARRRG